MTYSIKMKMVDYIHMSNEERRERGFADLFRELCCTEFCDINDSYDLYENTNDEDNHDLRKYAVYQRSTGELKCLLSDAGLALDLCYEDSDFRDKRHELYKQIAILAGWPEKLPMTWRSLRSKLNRLSDELLDMPVMVDDPTSDHYEVTSLSPYDLAEPASFDNPLSLTIDRF